MTADIQALELISNAVGGSVALDTPLRQDWERFLRLAERSLVVAERSQLVEWLSAHVQYFVPHLLLVAVRKLAEPAEFRCEVVSTCTASMSDVTVPAAILAFAAERYDAWTIGGGQPYVCNYDPVAKTSAGLGPQSVRGVDEIRSILVHGVKDAGVRGNCVYIVMQSAFCGSRPSSKLLEILLPYVDAAFRRCGDLATDNSSRMEFLQAPPLAAPTGGLSAREAEIMQWVSKGKTNQEVGLILQISLYTVKNHLHRIFGKLDVFNRAQAVGKFRDVIDLGIEAPAGALKMVFE